MCSTNLINTTPINDSNLHQTQPQLPTPDTQLLHHAHNYNCRSAPTILKVLPTRAVSAHTASHLSKNSTSATLTQHQFCRRCARASSVVLVTRVSGGELRIFFFSLTYCLSSSQMTTPVTFHLPPPLFQEITTPISRFPLLSI